MIVDLIPHDPPRRILTQSYPLRGRFWLGSVVGHIVWVAVAIHIPLATPASKRPIYDQFIRPLESKVLIYRPPKRVEEAAPEKRIGKSKEAKGRLIAPRTAIATAKNAASQKQLIFKPADLPEVKMDVPAPTVVARMEAVLPPPPKIAPKQFQAPQTKQAAVAKNVELTTALRDAAVVNVAQATPSIAKGLVPPPPKIAPKQFVAPKASARDPLLATRTEVSTSLTQPTPLVLAQEGLVTSSTTAALPKIAPKQFTAPTVAGGKAKEAARTEVTATLASAASVTNGAVGPAVPGVAFARLPGPPKDAPTAPEETRGNQPVNLAVASVNPTPTAEIPASSRSGEFAVAPARGEVSSGPTGPNALTVPNLTLREPAEKAKAPAKSNTLVYAERVRPSYNSVFTVPLRPAGRTLPRSVEPHFVGRSVYAVVIPFENFPAYGTDWILWFAEALPGPGPAPSLRPPVPTRKIERVPGSRESNDTRLQIAASLSTDGRLSNVRVLSAVSAAVQALAIEDLSSWEWKPATRNNAAVAIEAVFEIPFRLAVTP